jgi:response regulator RpfG family c-di-GMP phosphodiesterase
MRATRSQAHTHPVILIVEDARSRLTAIQSILETADFLVLPACNATEALELARSCANPIHLLITKLHPAEMSGPDLAAALRERSPEMSVLYTSANPLAALEIPDADEVVSCMLPTPLSREILLRRVNTLLAAHV